MSHRRCHNDVVVAPNNGLNSILPLLLLCNVFNKDDCGFENNSWLLILLLLSNGQNIF